MNHSLKFLGDGIYRDPRTGNLYHRPVIAGKRTTRKLTATTLTMARKEKAALGTRQLEARLGLAIDPYAALLTIGELAKEWLARNCPDRKGRERIGESLDAEKARVTRLLPFWSRKEARTITPEDCRDYHAWRIKQRQRYANSNYKLGRSVDAELTTLANLLNWAVENPRKTGLTQNPVAHRRRFNDLAGTRHCTAVMPVTDEAFHQLAAYLLASDQSRALGWQFLLEGLTGGRTSEILACRVDASAPRQPGFQDEHALHLNRLKKGIEPWALLEVIPGHSPLADCLDAFRHWHKLRYRCAGREAPYFIPGRDWNRPMDADSLTHALRRACKILKLPPVTSHGLRAYFVRTLRSLGVDDSEIAKRLGHRSGVALVEKTYGVSEPGWFGSRKQDFLPDGLPAWTDWLPPVNGMKSAYHRHTRSNQTESTGIAITGFRKAHKMPVHVEQSASLRKNRSESKLA